MPRKERPWLAKRRLGGLGGERGRDLSENQIKAVPRKAFRGITNVKNLQLDSNHISCIEDGAFRALRDLEILETPDSISLFLMGIQLL
ncbi:hypothetical protein NQZ68_039612 [Dissostichus eleginoides]|nr:hypothetical protein NQZ68_039612 [Dissostichus eleginoides]